jgi:hypothetical protein
MMRGIDTGRGVSQTTRSVTDIATDRAALLDTWAEQRLFLDLFGRVRQFAPGLADRPLDLEQACDQLAVSGPVTEAAMIEALASLRAEGVQL